MMKALLKLILVCGLFSLTGYSSMAQARSSMCPPAGKTIHFMLASSLTGCPFSAVIEIEHTQTLADGTHIQRRNRDLIYRDSLGRIRYEMYGPMGTDNDAPETPTMIRIYDPVEGFSYLLQPRSGIAYRNSLDERATSSKPDVQPQKSSGQAPASPPAQQTRPKPTVERLESQQMEGLLATGRRTTWTIPVGAEGNDRAFTTVSEIWNSSEMGITLLEKNSDPRSGDTERRTTNLKLTEPDAALFQVSADYTIKDQ